MIACLTQYLSAFLLPLLDGDANAYHLASCLLHDVDEGKASLTVGKEVVNNQHLVVGCEIWARDEHVVMALVGEGVSLRHVLVVGAVGSLTFFCKHYGHVVEVAEQCSDGYAARLDGKNFVDRLTAEASFELVCNLAYDVNVNLMVQEVIHFQDVAFLNHAVFFDFLFKEIHCFVMLFNYWNYKMQS